MKIYTIEGGLINAGLNQRVIDLIKDSEPKIVILSSNHKVSEHFSILAGKIMISDFESAMQIKNALFGHYLMLIDDLIETTEHHTRAKHFIYQLFQKIHSGFHDKYTIRHKKWLMALPEIITSVIFSIHLESRGIDHRVMYATDVIVKNEHGTVDKEMTITKVNNFITLTNNPSLILTQSSICSDAESFMDNLGTGGIELMATILAKATHTNKVQTIKETENFQGIVAPVLRISA